MSMTTELLQFFSIPVVASLIGYGTNVLAIQMTFLPLEYLGFGEKLFRKIGFSCGWQGIIPANAAKMARKAVVLLTTKIIKIRDVFDQLDPAEVVRLIQPVMRQTTTRILNKVAPVHFPDLWESLPVSTQAEVVGGACELAPTVVRKILVALKADIEEAVDLEDFAAEKLTEDPLLINEIFENCGNAGKFKLVATKREEFRFIERSGLYFGFFLGIIQMVIWYLLLLLRRVTEEDFPLGWFLPLAGALCGYLTNWIALWVIFKPIEPTRVAGVMMHGLFLRRQAEVSADFARLTAERVLTAENLWQRILYGPRRGQFEKIVRNALMTLVDEQISMIRPLVPFTFGSKEYMSLKADLASAFLDEFPNCVPLTYDYCEEAMQTETLLRTRLSDLPYYDFEGVLHPVFEEDEWKLIAVGGLLGGMVGVFQGLVVFGAGYAL